MDSILLTNLEIPFEFAGKSYLVRKANIQQVISFQRKAAEIGKTVDPGGDLLIAAYAIYLVLNAADKNVTEEFVAGNCPGDVDVTDILAKLGFLSQQKVEIMNKAKNALGLQTGLGSSER